MSLSLFPPSVGIKDVKGLVFQDKNIVSFKKINLDIPLSSLLSDERKVNLTIENPIVQITDKISSFSKSGVKTNSKFTVNKINLKDGDFYFTSDKLSVTLLKFNVFSYSRGDAISFRVISPHLKIEYMLGKSEIKLEGNLESEFIKKEKVFKIREFRWGTKGLAINGNGNIYKRGNIALHIFSSGEMESILYPILKNLALKGEIKGKTTIVKDMAGRILVNGNFSSPEVKIADEKFYNFQGLVRWNNRTKKVRVNSNVFWENSNTRLNIESKKGNTKINLQNISAAKAAKVVNVYKDVPMGGVIKSCNLDLKKGLLKGVVEIENERKSPEEFNVNGNFDIEYHTKEKWIKFKTSNTSSEFGVVRLLSGRVDPKAKKLSLTMDGNINELNGTGKYLKKYVDLNLDQWGLEKGKGKVKIRVQKTGKNTEIKSTLILKDFISNGVSLDGMIADIRNLNGVTDIDLSISDDELKGKVNLISKSGKLDFKFNNIEGESSSIFKILDINVGLTGRISGDFSYISEKGMEYPIITGKYSGDKLNFYDFIFKDVKGEIEVADHIFLKNLAFDYHRGKGISNILIDYNKEYFEVDGKITALDINDMNRGFSGRGDIVFSGKGNFLTDTIKIKYIFPEVYFYKERPFRVVGGGKISTDFSEYLIKTNGNLNKKKVSSPFTLSFGYGNDKYYGSFKFSLNDINIIMPWENNSGEMDLRGEISSNKSGKIVLKGVADLKGDYISFPGFPHTLDKFKGSLYFKDFDFTLRSFSGEMGGGDVTGNGMLTVEKGELKDILITFNGTNMFLFPMERANFRMNANLTLKKRKDKFVLGGAINFLSVLWEREVDEGISFYAGTSGENSKKSDFLENLQFDITMNGKDDIKVRNSFFNGKGELDLKLTGNKDFPVLTGSVSSRSGFVLISGRKFDLIKARLVFNNNVNINPLVRLEAETFIKNYRIKFVISGLSSRIRPEFISSPSLPPQDIIALISLGELFQRSSSTNISSEVGTTGLVTTALTDQIQKRVKKLFGIDMLKLDPDPTRSSLEGVSRLTIGKSISKDFLIVYSTDISRSTRDVYFFQYQITPTITLIGKRNEEGRLSLDIRFRKRY